MKSVVMISAVLLALVGFFASATSPNPSDHLAGKVLIAVAVGFALLAWFAPPKVTAWIFYGSIALVVVAYSLPMSFWRAVGLADKQSQHDGTPDPPASDR